jgi:hypothetical protein
MKKAYLFFFLLFYLHSVSAQQKVILKATFLRGESFVTVNVSEEDIEQQMREVLRQKGFEVVEEVSPNQAVFFVDLLFYQFPAEHPSATILLRGLNGIIYYVDREIIRLFIDRKATSLKLATVLLERFPNEINLDRFYRPALSEILFRNRASLIGLTTNSIIESYRKKYSIVFKWPESSPLKFIVPNELDEYMSYIVNYEGFRSKLKGGEIKLKLKVNSQAKFELLDLDAPFPLKDQQKARFQDFIDSFPLWPTNSSIENIEISLGMR